VGRSYLGGRGVPKLELARMLMTVSDQPSDFAWFFGLPTFLLGSALGTGACETPRGAHSAGFNLLSPLFWALPGHPESPYFSDQNTRLS
jgi:hypothetical protein